MTPPEPTTPTSAKTPTALPAGLPPEGSEPDLALLDAVTIDHVRSAARVLEGVAHRTPVVGSRTIEAMLDALGATGATVRLKCENFQRVGAFKFRGGYHTLSKLSDEQKRAGVVAFSSGNHAQAIALASALLGVRATILMPTNAPAAKLAATRGYLESAPEGSAVVTFDPKTTVREDLARQTAEQQGATLIPPYDHPDIIAGQGTAAYELVQDEGPFDWLFVCCGGGGLLSGCATASKGENPACRVVGVEPALGDDATRSFRTGKLCTVRNPPTIADGARTTSLGRYTFPIVLSRVDEMATVSEAQIAGAVRLCLERLKLVVEPSGALGLAGLLSLAAERPDEFRNAKIGVIVSGGNMDLADLPSILALADEPASA